MIGQTLQHLLDPAGQSRLSVLAIVGFAVAAAMSGHVLLRKRDVGSALGWIGLAWLSPFLGAFLYFVFGINRVQRRARRVRGPARSRNAPQQSVGPPGRDDHLAPLEAAATRLTERPPRAGNAIRLYRNGDTAYPPMLMAIRAARHSIGLSSYIFVDDEAGGLVVDALIAAHKRGVAVRVLIDGIGGGYFFSRAYERLRRHGVPAARFLHSPLPWRMPFLNLRSHKKVLVIDGSLGFTGGMNLAAQNLVSRKPRNPVRDTHFRVEGPVLTQLVEAFAADWAFATDEDLGQDWFPDLQSCGPAVARVVTSGPDQDLEKIALLILQAVGCARRTIHIMTPYFLPDERLVTALSLAASRGVSVEIAIPEHSDHTVMDWATRPNMLPLLQDGCRVWLNPPPFDHSKLMVVDGEWCMVGSANWDLRSLRLNFELNLEVYHCDLAAELEQELVTAKGRELTAGEIAGLSLPIRLRNAAARLMMPYL